MTAAELKAALDALIAEAAKKSDDADLKSKVAAAQAAYDAKVAQDAAAAGGDGFDPDKADEKTKKYIADLRKENAKYRTEAKDAKSKLETVNKALGGDAGTETAEQKVARLAAERETIAFDNAVLANAVEHGISKDGMKYFKYLIAEAAGELGDGEELAPEKIAAIAAEAKAKAVKPAATTTVTTTQGATTPPPTTGATPLTVEAFAALGFNEKCRLYEKDPTQYESLMKQATQKRLVK